MNRNDVSMQLYTTRKFQPYEPIFKFLSESGIKNIELFDLDKIDLDNFKSMMDDNDISIKSSHISFQAISDTNETIRRMKFLNISHAIVPSVPEKFNKDFASNFDLDEDTWNSFGKDLSSYVKIYEDKIPIDYTVMNNAAELNLNPIFCALNGGEDYELVFSLPKKWAKNLINLDKTISEIGYFTEGSPSVEFKNLKNDNFLKYKSFSHF